MRGFPVPVRGFRLGAIVCALGFAVAACDGGGGITPPTEDDAVATLTLDASGGWALVELGEPARQVTAADPSASTAWDLGVFATSVMLNGGGAGPGGVVGYCVCQNAQATDAEVRTMTPESELADFKAVTAASIPASESAWESDALVPVVAGWYAYDPATHVVSAASQRTWKLRLAETNGGFAKFRVVRLEGPMREHAGRVTFEYAVQPSKGAAMGPVRSATLDLSGGRVRFDLARGEVSDTSDWDLLFEGYTIRVNGGVSGSGQAGAVPVDDAFAAISDASDLQATLYRGDAYGGVFAEKRWYRYNLTGSDHQVWPTFDVYLVKRGSQVFKVQVTGYYSPSGEPRRITLRYAKLAG